VFVERKRSDTQDEKWINWDLFGAKKKEKICVAQIPKPMIFFSSAMILFFPQKFSYTYYLHIISDQTILLGKLIFGIETERKI
jgi:hypothetical protein